MSLAIHTDAGFYVADTPDRLITTIYPPLAHTVSSVEEVYPITQRLFHIWNIPYVEVLCSNEDYEEDVDEWPT